jgi:mannose-1-phosphate guanylyltransferase
VLERSVLDLIPDGEMVSVERDVFPRLIGEGLHALPLPGYWMDIGTPDRYLQATWDILERRVETELGDRLDEDGRLVDADVDLDERATVTGPALIEAGARIGPEAVVGPRAVVGSSCEIEAQATVSSSVLLEDCRVGEGATVRGSIAGSGAQVSAGATVADGSVLGPGESVD